MICRTSATLGVASPLTVQASGVTIVRSLEVELNAEPPPDTVAWLTKGDVANGATLTVTVMGGYDWPGPMEVPIVQVLVVQVHPLPAIDITDIPLGGFSVTVTSPLVGPAEAPLLILMV